MHVLFESRNAVLHTRSGVVACYNISTLCVEVDDAFMIFATFAVCACCLCQKNQRFELYTTYAQACNRGYVLKPACRGYVDKPVASLA